MRDDGHARLLADVAGDEVILDRVRLWEDLIAFRSPVFHPSLPVNLGVSLPGSVLGAPVLIDDEVAGIVEFFSIAPRRIDQATIETAQFLGWLVSQAASPRSPRPAERRADAGMGAASSTNPPSPWP